MNLEQEIIAIRRYIHQNPELGGCEFNTAKFIESKLKKLKMPYKRVGKTGVISTIEALKSRKTIALRADMDALPICEKNTNIEYISKKINVMHACGHDAHIAIILGAGKLLCEKKSELKGNVRLIFQPSEEVSDGAKSMINGGALKNPNVDFILGIHVNPWLKSGKIGLKFGSMMAAVDELTIEITGAIAHGAYPQQGKDALLAASIFVNMIQGIISREIDPIEPAVITLGKIEGGDAYNVICEKIILYGTVRTFNNKIRNLIKASILRKLKAIEMAYGVKSVFCYNEIGNALVNTPQITKLCIKTAKKFYGEDNIKILENPSMGGEDFSEYLSVVPGNYIYIGTSKDKSTSYPWHHSNFNIDESVMLKAAEYIAYTVEQFLE